MDGNASFFTQVRFQKSCAARMVRITEASSAGVKEDAEARIASSSLSPRPRDLATLINSETCPSLGAGSAAFDTAAAAAAATSACCSSVMPESAAALTTAATFAAACGAVVLGVWSSAAASKVLTAAFCFSGLSSSAFSCTFCSFSASLMPAASAASTTMRTPSKEVVVEECSAATCAALAAEETTCSFCCGLTGISRMT
mmetsp:Transcript_90433/g.125667  ORF Transcript_90433/g.125667 Transcript_90433/m.125667 type:complete len:200 (-) Transcript_90433:179-778(-)